MSQLDLCSRREADSFIEQGRVLLRGKRIEPIMGQKVHSDETAISIIHGENDVQAVNSWDWDRIRGDMVVLHKPVGYVSGQPDRMHGHTPAVRLLTRSNLYIDEADSELRETLSCGRYLNFARIAMRRRGQFPSREVRYSKALQKSKENSQNENHQSISTLLNFAPAGRLDLDSSGLLIFTKNGVLAKKLLSSSVIQKEYLVKVEPVQSLSREERVMGLKDLPYPPRWDLRALIRGGKRLWNESKPLKPLISAEWAEWEEDKKVNPNMTRYDKNTNRSIGWTGKGSLRLVLQEGRKRQIRRMCREILGLHVTELVRVRIGSVHLDNDLPLGMWRPLREKEAKDFLLEHQLI